MIEELKGDFLQWLRGFYFVAKTGSVRKAAELMRRNPSTISYQLRQLEEALGTVLFDRCNKTLRITPEGRDLLGWTISTFETLQNMRSAVGTSGGDLRGSIRIAATLPIAALSVGDISKFIREHPKIDLVIERGLSDDVRRAVADSEVDFGLLPVIAKPKIDMLEIVYRARPLLVIHKDNPWGIPPIPDLEDLQRLPYVSFCARDSPDELGNHMAAMGMGNFIQKNSVIQINNYHLILRFVWQKLGVTIMDELCYLATIFGANWDCLAAIRLDHLLPNRLYGILTRRHKHISPQAGALIKVLRERFLSISSMDACAIWPEARQMDVAETKAAQKKAGQGRPKRKGIKEGE